MDEQVCDKLLLALEELCARSGEEGGLDTRLKNFQREWKAIWGLFGKARNRAGLKAELLKARIPPERAACLIAMIRICPAEFFRQAKKNLPANPGGGVTEFSHEDRQKFHQRIQKRPTEQSLSEAIRQAARNSGISEREGWRIWEDDPTTPEYWEKVIRLGFRQMAQDADLRPS